MTKSLIPVPPSDMAAARSPASFLDSASASPTMADAATAPLPAAADVSPAIWGLSTSFDLYDCDPETIRDADAIRRFVVELCELIEMRRFGETQVVHFGEDERVAGFSMVQLIETSLISGHFANLTNAVYLDVFSCKLYEPQKVEDFAVRFFGAGNCLRSSSQRL